MSDITGIADNEILDEVLKDLDEMEHSRDYWKSKALQYKMDLNGAQRGIRRLKKRKEELIYKLNGMVSRNQNLMNDNASLHVENENLRGRLDEFIHPRDLKQFAKTNIITKS